MAPQTDPTPGYAMIGIIIEGGPGGAVFLKAIGPAETINAQEDALMKMAKSAKLAG
jgi:hypothetical protein